MKILITNTELSNRSGSELYVKEVAEELIWRGHVVAAYSTQVRELGKEMIEAGIETVDNLSELSWVPDIIHGQHHMEAMTALARFPGVPAIYICHGYRPWQETPPLHPRIMQYFAVDSRTLDYAVKHHGVPQDAIRLIHNFVDLCRFKQRPPLPERPQKALVFNNVANSANYLPLVQAACNKAGIAMDTIGLASGRISSRPEEILKDYDLVFAVGRSALEALATGAALVICNDFGVGPMATAKDMLRLRDLNFGIAAIHSRPDASAIYNEILKYDANDAAVLTTNLRALIGIKPAVDKLEFIYAAALDKFSTSKVTIESESVAFSANLRNISVFIKRHDKELEEKKNELHNMKLSKFWKLREQCKAIKNLFSRRK